MVQVLVVGVLAGLAVVIAAILRRRGGADPEQGPSWTVPAQLDRADFARPEAPWLVAVFSSTTCLACASTWKKAVVLDSEAVAVTQLDAVEQRTVHERYGIDAVPLVLVADRDGVVQRSFVGPPTATDLWAAVAELREPGTVPPSCTD